MSSYGLSIEIAGTEDWPDETTSIVHKAINAACDYEDFLDGAPAELSILLSDDVTVKELNTEWRGKASPTNVLSFPANTPSAPGLPRLLGDIVFARETIEREAVEQNKTIEAHLMHLVVHGFLHLLGFDHVDPDAADEMEALEVEILATLGVANPYLEIETAAAG